jgi:cytochrome c oxidase assembly protein subunit 15
LLIVITLATSQLWRRISMVGTARCAVREPLEALPTSFRTPQRGVPTKTLARIAIFTTAVIYVQLGLGATMRHQHRDLAILDFPAAYGQIIPTVTTGKLAQINEWRNARALSEVTAFQIWLQMAHRFLALVIAGGVIACLFRARAAELRDTPLARFSDMWFLLLACQVTLGAWVIWSNKAADIATAHVALGATMLALGVTISAISLRLSQRPEGAPAPRSYLVSEKLHAS